MDWAKILTVTFLVQVVATSIPTAVAAAKKSISNTGTYSFIDLVHFAKFYAW